MRPGIGTRWLVVMVLAAAASLVIIANTPLFAYPATGKDDALFVRLAGFIRETGWLGPFDQLTLAKGMAYPVLLAIADALSVPAKIAEQLVYLAGAAAMGWVAVRLGGRAPLGVVLFSALALDPVRYLDPLTRLGREAMYAGTALLLVAGVAWVFLVRLEDSRPWRLRDYIGATLVGLAGGVYWLVREEGAWLVPSVGLIAAVGIARAVWHGRRGSPRRTVLVSAGGVLLVALGFGVLVGAVVALNGARYGVTLANDFRDGAFPRAVGAFARVEEAPWERYVAVAEVERQAIYAVSPAAAELADYLERRVAAAGLNQCRAATLSRFVEATGIEVNCEDYGFGWFPWELRDAVYAAGHWDDGAESQAFLDRLADEIDAACEDGRLTCGPSVVSATPPLRLDDIRDAVGLFPTAFRILAGSEGSVGMAASRGDTRSLLDWARSTHGLIAPPEGLYGDEATALVVRGFIASPVGAPTVHVERGLPDAFSVSVSARPERELFGALDPVDAAALDQESWTGGLRFELETDCVADDCQFVVNHGDGSETALAVWALAPGWTYAGDGTVIRVLEAAETTPWDEALLRQSAPLRDEKVVRVQRWLHGLYQALVPLLSLLAVLGCVGALLVPSVRRRAIPLGTLTVAAGGAVLVRFGIITMLEVSAWPGALAIGKLSSASPFLITFAVIGTYLLAWSVVTVGQRVTGPVAR